MIFFFSPDKFASAEAKDIRRLLGISLRYIHLHARSFTGLLWCNGEEYYELFPGKGFHDRPGTASYYRLSEEVDLPHVGLTRLG